MSIACHSSSDRAVVLARPPDQVSSCLQALHMLCDPELRRNTPEFDAVAQEVLRQARLWQSLSHPNIVQLRGVTMHAEHGHVQWLVTERASGGSLEAWLAARGHLTLQELLELLRGVMAALAYLHSRVPAVVRHGVTPSTVLAFTSADGTMEARRRGHRQGVAVTGE